MSEISLRAWLMRPYFEGAPIVGETLAETLSAEGTQLLTLAEDVRSLTDAGLQVRSDDHGGDTYGVVATIASEGVPVAIERICEVLAGSHRHWMLSVDGMSVPWPDASGARSADVYDAPLSAFSGPLPLILRRVYEPDERDRALTDAHALMERGWRPDHTGVEAIARRTCTLQQAEDDQAALTLPGWSLSLDPGLGRVARRSLIAQIAQ